MVPPSRIRRSRRAVTADTSAPILVQQLRQEQRGVGTASIGTRLGCGILGSLDTISPRHRHDEPSNTRKVILNEGEGKEWSNWGNEGTGGQQLSPFTQLFLSLISWSFQCGHYYFHRSKRLHPRSTVIRHRVMTRITATLVTHPRLSTDALPLSFWSVHHAGRWGVTMSRQRAWFANGTERKRRPTRNGSTWRTDGSAVIFPTSAPSIVALSAPTRSPPRGPELSPPPLAILAGRRAVPCFSRPHHRPFHPRPHPTLRSSRESFFLASRPSRLLWRCVSRLISFFLSPSPFCSISFSLFPNPSNLSTPIRLVSLIRIFCTSNRPRFLRNDTRSMCPSSNYFEDLDADAISQSVKKKMQCVKVMW